MALSVNTNVAALNAYRNLNTTQNDMSKSLEKLSSGFRINRAADDAAGLAISEGMRSQIGGIKMGVRNAQDGISVVQTAEGALNETHSILQRMRDLSVQASNSGSLNDDAKANIQTEVTQLNSELTRISDTTKFNGKPLLDGNYSGTFQVGANSGETISVGLKGTALGSVGLGTSVIDVTAEADSTHVDGATTATVYAAAGKATNVGTVVATSGSGGLIHDLKAADAFAINGVKVDLSSLDDSSTATELAAAINGSAGMTATASVDAGKITLTSKEAGAVAGSVTTDADAATTAIFDGTATAGSAAVMFDSAKLTANANNASGASKAIDLIDKAIATVSSTRSDLGAVQNRFEHTINNQNVAVENLTASESRIRDTDMASEMISFTRAQILSQAGTAMLAQAKSIPQGVLQLLQ